MDTIAVVKHNMASVCPDHAFVFRAERLQNIDGGL